MAVRVITLFFLVFLPLTAFADSLTGKVVKITDGDTLRSAVTVVASFLCPR